ncbi:MAG: ABC transporter permease [Oceanospirillaceae bacterium]|nr:ABC transporter permease [Oceanospirillaceae bacterium]
MQDIISTLQSFMNLEGYGDLLWQGTWMTVKLSLLSFCLSMVIGVFIALVKSAKHVLPRLLATFYTTLIRGIPDLVLMLLIFYGVQNWVGELTVLLGWKYIYIDPFTAGVITLGFIYGAYFSETFRGALQSIPEGQKEAAVAYGLSKWQSFRYIVFPQMMRLSLPGLSNVWQVIIKSTALISIIGLNDLISAAVQAGKSSNKVFFFLMVSAVIFLAYSILSNVFFAFLKRHFHVGIKEAN